MSPEERAYKILQESNFVKYMEDDGKVQQFLESIEECTWENPTNKIEERQFETSLKGWFKQYIAELIEFAKNNPSTFEGRENDLKHVGLHTMDDQGFEGQVMSDGSFWRIINDSIESQAQLRCDFADIDEDSILTCTEQAKMHALGFVMDYDSQWIKKDEIKTEIQSASVDWCHVHNHTNCQKVKEFYEND